MLFRYFCFVITLIVSVSSSLYAMTAAGVLPFFDDGTVLLGKEYRPRYASYAWMEFGGEQEPNESLAQTAHREANEETAKTLEQHITLIHLQQAEENGHYVDHCNITTGVSYRMYFIRIYGQKPSIETFHKNAKKLGHNAHVEKEDWGYFDASLLMNAHNQDNNLPGTNAPLYSTMKERLKKPETQQFFKGFINSLKDSL